MSNSSTIKVIDISPGEYSSDVKDLFPYEIKDSPLTIKDAREKNKFKRQNDFLKKLPVRKMFVVDFESKDASKWVSRWGKRLGRRFIVRKLTDKLTEIHRVE